MEINKMPPTFLKYRIEKDQNKTDEKNRQETIEEVENQAKTEQNQKGLWYLG